MNKPKLAEGQSRYKCLGCGRELTLYVTPSGVPYCSKCGLPMTMTNALLHHGVPQDTGACAT